MAKVTYDTNIIDEFATQLYRQADSIVASYTLLGALVGGLVGYMVGNSFGAGSPAAVVFALVCAAVGYGLAQPRAFLLRLQAQQALCQVQIEKNTRAPIPPT